MEQLVCPICKKNFEKTTHNKKYCSSKCLNLYYDSQKKGNIEVKKHCLFCGNIFVHSNKSPRKYCSEKCCTKNQKIKKQTYITDKINGRIGGIHPNFCVYCGDFNQCRDHVIPVSYNSVHRDYFTEDTVDCCNICNQLALDYPAQCIEEKSLYLINQYQKKYSKVLNNPKWEDDEIDELSGNLKYKVKASENLKRLIESKLENLHLSSMGTLPKRLKTNIGFYF